MSLSPPSRATVLKATVLSNDLVQFGADVLCTLGVSVDDALLLSDQEEAMITCFANTSELIQRRAEHKELLINTFQNHPESIDLILTHLHAPFSAADFVSWIETAPNFSARIHRISLISSLWKKVTLSTH